MSARISSLPVVVSANIADTDILPIVTGIASNTGVTKRVSITELRLKLGTTPPAGGRTVTSASTYLTNNAVFNVKDFGAFGDGATDDTTAIQNAINACNTAGGGTVRIPLGTFMITGVTIPGNNITLEGMGSHFGYASSVRRFSILKAKVGAAATLVQMVSNPDALPDITNCVVQNLSIDGNLISSYGIRSTGSNLLKRVHATGCLTAGINLYNFTNGTRVEECAMVSNFGWGMVVFGPSSTPFSLVRCHFMLNNQAGCWIEGGFLGTIEDCIFESNSNAGLVFYKRAANTNEFGQFRITGCWFEDNADTALGTIVIDADTRSLTTVPMGIWFENCHISTSVVGNHYANLAGCRWVTFSNCHFSGSTATSPIKTSATAFNCALINCSPTTGLTTYPLTHDQIEQFVLDGTKCWWADRETRRVVGAGSPAVAFQNSWAAMGGAHSVPQYWFDIQGNVHLEGHVSSGTIGNAIFTLPVGYRPSKSRYFAIFSNDAFGSVEVTSAGLVKARAGSNVSFSLNGISFSTD